MSGKRVLLIVGGGVAAYKALETARLLIREGVAVRPMLTAGGAQFITPLSLSAICHDKVHQDLFSLTEEAEMGHIELSRSADLIAVVPATADLMAKAAQGLAPDLATTTLLATDKPVLMAPAMNVRMWNHPATQRNLATLIADGVRIVGPDEGEMACGEFGPGRLASPEVIVAAILDAVRGEKPLPLAGRRILVTAGPTVEPIDPVRFIANRSSGKQGFAIAGALEEAVSDGHGRIYVNVEDKAEVAVIDTRAKSVLAHYPLTGCEGPTGLALDSKSGRLVSACANKVAVVTDAATGAVKGSLAIGPGPDGAAYDVKSGFVFVPTGRDGKLTAIDAAAVKVVKILDSEKSARTGDLDPVGGVFYSVAAKFEAPKPGVARAPAIPGTVHLVAVSIR